MLPWRGRSRRSAARRCRDGTVELGGGVVRAKAGAGEALLAGVCDGTVELVADEQAATTSARTSAASLRPENVRSAVVQRIADPPIGAEIGAFTTHRDASAHICSMLDASAPREGWSVRALTARGDCASHLAASTRTRTTAPTKGSSPMATASSRSMPTGRASSRCPTRSPWPRVRGERSSAGSWSSGSWCGTGSWRPSIGLRRPGRSSNDSGRAPKGIRTPGLHLERVAS